MLINTPNLTALSTSLRAAFSKGMQSGTTQYARFASVIPSASSRNTYPDLSQWPAFRRWVGDRVFKNINAKAYSIENETFEASVDVKREDIEDDNLGVSAHIAETSGLAAATLPDELVGALLKTGLVAEGFDAKPFFASDHMGRRTSAEGQPEVFADQSNIVGNPAEPLSAILMCTTRPFKPVIVQPRRDFVLTANFDATSEAVFHRNTFEYGSDGRVGVGFGPWMLAVGIFGTLDAAKYAEARARMSAFESTEGRSFNLSGDLLLVGGTSEAAGREILKADRTTGGKTNIWNGSAELMVSQFI